MEDSEFYPLAVLIALLGVIGLLQTKILKRHDQTIADLRADVEFLKDHTVTVETEARP
jgi:hypothetical protein